MDHARGAAPVTRSRQLAMVATGLQAGGMLVLAAVDAAETFAGSGADRARGLTGAALFLVLAGALVVLVMALRRSSTGARTPLVVWNALLVPVAVSLAQSGQVALATGVAATIVVAVIAGLVAGRGRP